jgi:hypothetical protein
VKTQLRSAGERRRVAIKKCTSFTGWNGRLFLPEGREGGPKASMGESAKVDAEPEASRRL